MSDYSYRKSLEGNERLPYEKKRKIREALEEGKPIPTELQNEEAALRREIDLEDEKTGGSRRDPKILITTSRSPSGPLKQFAKELKLVFPNEQQMNRGGQDTRHDIKDKKAMGTMSQVYPHLVLDNFTTKLGERTANILKHLFPVAKPDSKCIITFANWSDYISFRHHTCEKHGGPKSIELMEIGPQFEMKLFKITLGTLDQTEWVLKPYTNTAKKQKYIGL